MSYTEREKHKVKRCKIKISLKNKLTSVHVPSEADKTDAGRL